MSKVGKIFEDEVEDDKMEIEDKNEGELDDDAVSALKELYHLVQKCEEVGKKILEKYRKTWWVIPATAPVKALAGIMVMISTMIPSPIPSAVLKTVGGGLVLAAEVANPVARLSDINNIKEEINQSKEEVKEEIDVLKIEVKEEVHEVIKQIRGLKRKLDIEQEARDIKKSSKDSSTQTVPPNHLRQCGICNKTFWRQNIASHMNNKH